MRRRAVRLMTTTGGLILATMVISAFIFSIAALAALAVAYGQSQQAKELHQDRLGLRYAAEAGLVWATQKLWNSPNPNQECFTDNPDLQLDHDNNPATPLLNIDIVPSIDPPGPCPFPPGVPITLEATVSPNAS